MVFISPEIEYMIFFIAALIPIGFLIYKIYKKVRLFLTKIYQFPNEIKSLKLKHNTVSSEVQNLKEKIYKIEGQMDICCRIVDNLDI